MNPLGFFATSLALVGAIKQIQRLSAVPGEDSNVSVLTDLLSAVGPYLHYVVLGMLCFLLLRLLSPRRGGILAAGVALYAGGLASVLTSLALEPILLILRWHEQSAAAAYQQHFVWIAVPVVGGFLVFSTVLVLGLSGTLGAARWTAVGALAVCWVLTGILFGWLHPPGEYGFHLLLEFHRSQAGSASISTSLAF